jgi:putative hydrolase of the HAD superfamily
VKTDGVNSIIFDLGGVLLNIDYDATINAFRNLGLRDPEKAFSKQIQADIFQRFEKGLIDQEEFLNYLKNETRSTSTGDLKEAWCALLGDFPSSRFKMLENLSNQYELYILSNTNIIHQQRFESYIDTIYGWGNFESLFRKIYYSHQIGLRKPDKEIYEFVLGSSSLNPLETLFVDDTEVNLIPAKQLGIKILTVGLHDEVTDLLHQYSKIV